MSGKREDRGARKEITVELPAELLGRLLEFCREKGIDPGRVVERALRDYFREGDMSH